MIRAADPVPRRDPPGPPPGRADPDPVNAGRPWWRRNDVWYVALIAGTFALSVALLLLAHVVLPLVFPDAE